tara:strand:- start:734 stop:1651 length:918 start_codon:yes stop_codon:yes gene_type:complete
MAIANSYPTGTPKSGDLLLGTSSPTPGTNDKPTTRNFPVSGISTLIAAEIPQGVPGPAGQDGAPGANGSNGSNGSNGDNGADGDNGSDGADGAPGSNGANGQDGAQGAAGADGTSIEIQGTKPTVADLPATGNTVGDLWIIDQTGGGATAGDGYVWTVGGAWLNIGPLRGPQGIQGIAGSNGTDGAAGTPGATGAAGADGADGTDGADGQDGTDGTDGAPGATGSQGQQGIQGPTGAVGGVSSVTAGTNITVSPTVGDVVVSAPDAVVNTGDIFPSTPKVTNIVSLTSAQYPPATVDGNTLYVII